MLSAKTVGRLKLPSVALMLVCSALTSGCSKGTNGSSIGTFRMGEKVQVGPLVYQVFESNWRSELGSGGRTPKNRYMFVKLSITNTSNKTISTPTLTLEGAGQTYMEVTEDMDKVDNWFGLLRNIPPSQTEQGWIVFDAPMTAYKLVVTDAGEIGREQHGYIDIPVQLE